MANQNQRNAKRLLGARERRIYALTVRYIFMQPG